MEKLLLLLKKLLQKLMKLFYLNVGEDPIREGGDESNHYYINNSLTIINIIVCDNQAYYT